jgi:hypothetical protein
MCVDFNNSSEINLEQLTERKTLSFVPTDFYCEEQYEKLGKLLAK